VANKSENPLPSLQSSNFERRPNSDTFQVIGQALNFTNHTDISTAVANLTGTPCEDLAGFGKRSALCNLTSDPLTSFKDLKESTALFNYAGYYDDLNDVEKSPDDPEIPDDEYFALTSENIVRSRVFEWYSAWTVVHQGTPEWAEHGEWKLFYMQFFGERNFRCNSGSAHCVFPPPKTEDIRQRFPDNRPLGRRVLIVAHIYDKMHELTYRVDVCLLL
jgi:hypothetical protein